MKEQNKLIKLVPMNNNNNTNINRSRAKRSSEAVINTSQKLMSHAKLNNRGAEAYTNQLSTQADAGGKTRTATNSVLNKSDNLNQSLQDI